MLFKQEDLSPWHFPQIQYSLLDAAKCETTELILLVHLFHSCSSSPDHLDVWPELNLFYSSLIPTTLFSGSPETFSIIW